MAWTTSNTRFESTDFMAAQELSPTDSLMQDDSIPDEQVHLSDDEDSGNDHLPKADSRKDWWKPLPEEKRPATPEPAWTIPSSNRVKYFQLGIESYQTQLNLTKPGWYATGYEFMHDYTIIESPRAVVFPVDNNDRKIMRFNEIYKFSDGTLTHILEALDYRVMEFKVKRLNPATQDPQRILVSISKEINAFLSSSHSEEFPMIDGSADGIDITTNATYLMFLIKDIMIIRKDLQIESDFSKYGCASRSATSYSVNLRLIQLKLLSISLCQILELTLSNVPVENFITSSISMNLFSKLSLS
ncbi:hypothetical protein Tco_1329639 [Tanacetum coccineum]